MKLDLESDFDVYSSLFGDGLRVLCIVEISIWLICCSSFIIISLIRLYFLFWGEFVTLFHFVFEKTFELLSSWPCYLDRHSGFHENSVFVI